MEQPPRNQNTGRQRYNLRSSRPPPRRRRQRTTPRRRETQQSPDLLQEALNHRRPARNRYPQSLGFHSLTSTLPPTHRVRTLPQFLQWMGGDDAPRFFTPGLAIPHVTLPRRLSESSALPESLRNQLPVFSFDEHMKLANECYICLEAYAVHDVLVRLPCLHAFHKKCIFQWLRLKSICPCCRQDIKQGMERGQALSSSSSLSLIPESRGSSRE